MTLALLAVQRLQVAAWLAQVVAARLALVAAWLTLALPVALRLRTVAWLARAVAWLAGVVAQAALAARAESAAAVMLGCQAPLTPSQTFRWVE